MTAFTEDPSPSRNSTLQTTLAWFRHMRAALQRPIPHDITTRHRDFARLVDHGISRIRSTGIDPRI